MSREIKFRVWDIKRQRLAYPKEFYLSIYECKFGDGGSPRKTPINKVIIEQYTGNKDKNGKEIFEGDIVKCMVHHQVRLDSGAMRWGDIFEIVAWIRYCETGTAFILHTKSLIYLNQCSLIEIIGNIHQNKELLNAT